MDTKRKVALLGTGIMGSAMARNLLRAGHEVHVWNRDQAKTFPLADAGAQAAASPAQAVAGVDVVVTMLFDAAAVTEVVRQAAGGVGPGTAWVQSTTVGVHDAPALADLATLSRTFGPCRSWLRESRPSRAGLCSAGP